MGIQRFLRVAFFAVAFCAPGFAVADILRPGWGMDGFWTIPGADGQGFDMQYIQRPNGGEELIIYWYAYDGAGTKQAYILAGGPIIGNSAAMEAYTATNGIFDNATPIVRTPAGRITMTLLDCNTATMSWQIVAPLVGIISTSTRTIHRLSPLAQSNGKILCSGEVSGLAQSDDRTQVRPVIGNDRVVVYSNQGQLLVNERAPDLGALMSFYRDLDDCADVSYTASCSSFGTPTVRISQSVDRQCVANNTRVDVPGNPVAISDTLYGYLTDGRVRVQRVRDNAMIVDETTMHASTVEVSENAAGFITASRVRVVDLNGRLLADENASRNARVAVSNTMYAYVSGDLFRVYRLKDNSLVFETGIDGEDHPVIRVTNSRAYYFGIESRGFVVDYEGRVLAQN